MDYTTQTLGTRTEDGGRIGTCPTCGRIGKVTLTKRPIGNRPVGIPLNVAMPSDELLSLEVIHVTGKGACLRPLPADNWITIQDLARWCGVEPVTINAAINRKRLPAKRIPGFPWKIEADDAIAYMRAEPKRGGWPKGKPRKAARRRKGAKATASSPAR